MADYRSDIRLVGLDYLQMGPVKSTGAMQTASSLNTIGNVLPDSAHLVIEPETENDLYIEEEDTPDISLLSAGKKYIEFALRDMGTQTLLQAFGGVAAAGVYSFPVTARVVNEKCVFAQSITIGGKAIKIEIPRAAISNGGDLKFARTDSGTLTFKCSILIPSSSTQISPCVITQV